MVPPVLNGHAISTDSGRDIEEHLLAVSEQGDPEDSAVNTVEDAMIYEDTDTPATLMNSRHSAPSDDTVFGEGDEPAPSGKVSAVTTEEPHPPVAPITPAPAPIPDDDLVDEDAEGEDDVDAEGEPDDEEELMVLATVSMNIAESVAQEGQVLSV